MNIRRVEETDNDQLALLIRQVFEEFDAPREGTVFSDPTTNYLFNLFQKEHSVLWVASEGDDILGCCGIYPTANLPNGCCELVKFYLKKNARGKGIGKELLARSIDSAKQFGYSKIYLETLPDFGTALNIYEKHGFERLSAPLGNTGHSGCNIWMLLSL